MRCIFLGFLTVLLLALNACGGPDEWARRPRYGEPGTALEASPPYSCPNPLYVVKAGTYNGVVYGPGCYCLVFVSFNGPVPYNYPYFYGGSYTTITVYNRTYGGFGSWW